MRRATIIKLDIKDFRSEIKRMTREIDKLALKLQRMKWDLEGIDNPGDHVKVTYINKQLDYLYMLFKSATGRG